MNAKEMYDAATGFVRDTVAEAALRIMLFRPGGLDVAVVDAQLPLRPETEKHPLHDIDYPDSFLGDLVMIGDFDDKIDYYDSYSSDHINFLPLPGFENYTFNKERFSSLLDGYLGEEGE
ncbi:hypothetical protein GOV06_03345 [Candidatus Woesearchaeota archaeon]|nr:hypothetical protein [Candidatus Woesearchaeota archaeon]